MEAPAIIKGLGWECLAIRKGPGWECLAIIKGPGWEWKEDADGGEGFRPLRVCGGRWREAAEGNGVQGRGGMTRRAWCGSHLGLRALTAPSSVTPHSPSPVPCSSSPSSFGCHLSLPTPLPPFLVPLSLLRATHQALPHPPLYSLPPFPLPSGPLQRRHPFRLPLSLLRATHQGLRPRTRFRD